MHVDACRSCGQRGLRPFLDLGETPLADALVAEADIDRPDKTFPLEIAFCESCALVQLLHELPPTTLFVDNYHYFSSFSDALLQHSRSHALGLIRSRGLGDGNLVVEIASNDGYLLRNFVEAGVPVLGIDPSPGPAAAADAIGVPTLRKFFGSELARELVEEQGRADVIIANNVLAHVPDLNGFVEGLRILVADDGLITIENPYVRDLIEHCEFDTIYHEHLCYFSCTAIDNLMRRHGLFLNDVEYFPRLHGGTLRWHVGPVEQVQESVRAILDQEKAAGMCEFRYYEGFAAQVYALRDRLCDLVSSLRREGHSLAAYGAAAKGATLLNFSGLTASEIDFVVDRNVHKQGKLMPGAHVPIRGPEELLTQSPDYVLLLAWNFRDEILAQQEAYLSHGGRFVIPIPWPEIVGNLEPAVTVP